jgi:hypothetical protein
MVDAVLHYSIKALIILPGWKNFDPLIKLEKYHIATMLPGQHWYEDQNGKHITVHFETHIFSTADELSSPLVIEKIKCLISN